jgi:DNA replication protein DnaC
MSAANAYVQDHWDDCSMNQERSPIDDVIVKEFPDGTTIRERGGVQYITGVRRSRSPERIIEESGIPPRYLGADLDALRFKPQHQRALLALREYQPMTGAPNVIILGGTGRGKSLLAGWLAEKHAKIVVWVNWERLLTEITSSWRGELREDEILARYQRCALLVIDDLAKSTAAIDDQRSKWESRLIGNLINYRYEYLLPTVITTELRLEGLQGVIQESNVKRLVENSIVVDLSDQPEHRMQNKRSKK